MANSLLKESGEKRKYNDKYIQHDCRRAFSTQQCAERIHLNFLTILQYEMYLKLCH